MKAGWLLITSVTAQSSMLSTEANTELLGKSKSRGTDDVHSPEVESKSRPLL